MLSQGYKPEEVGKIIVVMNDPVAYQHALTTNAVDKLIAKHASKLHGLLHARAAE